MNITELSAGDHVRILHDKRFYFGTVTETDVKYFNSRYVTSNYRQEFIGSGPTNQGVKVAGNFIAYSPHPSYSKISTRSTSIIFHLLSEKSQHVVRTDICDPTDVDEKIEEELCNFLTNRLLQRITRTANVRFVVNQRLVPIQNARIENQHLVFEIDGQTQRVGLDKCSTHARHMKQNGYVVYGPNVKKKLHKETVIENYGFPPEFEKHIENGNVLRLSTKQLAQWATALYYDPELLERVATQAIRDQITKRQG